MVNFPKPKTRTFESEGARLSYRVWRADDGANVGMPAGVPVVLLHGFAQSAQSWDEVARLLLEKVGERFLVGDASAVSGLAESGASVQLGLSNLIAAVYALDFVGHGESERPEDAGAYDMDAVCSSVLGFARFVAQREGALPVIVGYSMGGRIALECLARCHAAALSAKDAVGAVAPTGGTGCASGTFGGVDSRNGSLMVAAAEGAQSFPRCFPASALVLESAGLGPKDEGARSAFGRRNAEWAAQVRKQGVEDFMRYWASLPLFESQRALPREARARLQSGRLANDAEALARTFEGTGQHRQALAADSAAALRAAVEGGLPVLYIAGELDAKYAAVAEEVAVALGAASAVAADAAGTANAAATDAASTAGESGPSDPFPKTLIVSGAGHNVHLENPQAFAKALASCFRLLS